MARLIVNDDECSHDVISHLIYYYFASVQHSSNAAVYGSETCPGKLKWRRIAVIILTKCRGKPRYAALAIFGKNQRFCPN